MPTNYDGPADALARYDALVASRPDVDRKGATMPYTSCGGHMVSFLDKTGSMALRLPADLREQFIAEYATGVAEQHGRVMAEFVVVPASLLENPDELGRWFDRSHDWAETLPPKPTKRS